jgi:hypothetical protein
MEQKATITGDRRNFEFLVVESDTISIHGTSSAFGAGFVGDGDRPPHIAGLNECRDQQSNGGDTQNGSRVKKTLGEKCQLPSVFGELGVCFIFIAPFLSFLGALGVCFWGWCNIYNDRWLLGLGLLLVAFGFGNLGWWLLYPRLIPF